FKQKTAYEMIWRLEFRRVLFRSHRVTAVPGSRLAPDVLHEDWNIFGPIAQRRHRDADDVEPVQQVEPEAAGGGFRPKVAVGCGRSEERRVGKEGGARGGAWRGAG